MTTNDGTIRLFRIDVIRNSKSKNCSIFENAFDSKNIYGNDHDGSGNCNGTKISSSIEQIKFYEIIIL